MTFILLILLFLAIERRKYFTEAEKQPRVWAKWPFYVGNHLVSAHPREECKKEEYGMFFLKESEGVMPD